MNKQNDAADRTLTLERVLNAPIEIVWEAWTQPEHIAHWWGPGKMEVKIVDHEFKVGGRWKYIMAMPDGSEFVTEGVYSEIIELKKIVSSADFKPMTEGVTLQALFEADGDKTKFTFSVIHPTVEYCKQQEKMGFYNGWGSVFGRLDSYLATLVDE